MFRKVKGNRIEEYNDIYYYYDELGNIIQREYQNVIWNFYYDTENQLEKVESFTQTGKSWHKEIWVYAYDPFGRRLSKSCRYPRDKKHNIRYIWDRDRLIQEYTPNAVYTYIYEDQDSFIPAIQHARYQDEQGIIHEKLHYFHCDQVGIPREMTDKLGNLTWFGEYRALGQLAREVRIDPYVHQPFRLQGQYFDLETGLHYNRFRYYDPYSGRFLNQDPIGLDGGMNPYTYAPNTQMWADPLGLVKILVGKRGISVHANPGPNATPPGSRAEHNPPHVHLGSNDGPRMSTETFEPFSDADKQKMSRDQEAFCKGLKKEKDPTRREIIQRRQKQVFDTGSFDK